MHTVFLIVLKGNESRTLILWMNIIRLFMHTWIHIYISSLHTMSYLQPCTYFCIFTNLCIARRTNAVAFFNSKNLQQKSVKSFTQLRIQ